MAIYWLGDAGHVDLVRKAIDTYDGDKVSEASPRISPMLRNLLLTAICETFGGGESATKECIG